MYSILQMLIVFFLSVSLSATAAEASKNFTKNSLEKPRAQKPKTIAAKNFPATCSPEWLDSLNSRCDGSDNDNCFSMLNQGRKLLASQRKVMNHVLNDPDGFATAEKKWDIYRDAECDALEPQCPEGQSGSCNTPTAICEVRLNCEHVGHLLVIECSTNSYNRSLEAPPKPNACLADGPAIEQTIELNTATAERLDDVNGIGPARASKIIKERAVSPFQDCADFMTRIQIRESLVAAMVESGLRVNGKKCAPPPNGVIR